MLRVGDLTMLREDNLTWGSFTEKAEQLACRAQDLEVAVRVPSETIRTGAEYNIKFWVAIATIIAQQGLLGVVEGKKVTKPT